jgi:hypothetical protein
MLELIQINLIDDLVVLVLVDGMKIGEVVIYHQIGALLDKFNVSK